MIKTARPESGRNDSTKKPSAGSIHYAWLICAAATIGVFCASGLGTTAFSVYQPYLADALSLSNTQSSFLILIRNISQVLAVMMIAPIVRKISLRLFIPAGMVLAAAGFLFFGMAGSYAMCCAATVVVGAANGFGSAATACILLARWFHSHRGVAVGIAMSATGLSAFLASPVITLITESFSLQASFWIEAGFILACAVLCRLVIRDEPTDMGLAPLGAEDPDTDPVDRTSEKKQEKSAYLRRRPSARLIHLLLFSIFLMGIASNCFYSCLSLHFKTLDFNSAQIAVFVSVFGLMLAIGKVIYGELSDVIGSYLTSWIFYGIALVGIFLSVFAAGGSFLTGICGSAAAGFGMAVSAGVASFYSVDLSVEADYADNVSHFQLFITLGGLIFNPVMGVMADRFGNYVIPFRFLFVSLLTAAILIQSLYRKIRREDAKPSPAHGH